MDEHRPGSRSWWLTHWQTLYLGAVGLLLVWVSLIAMQRDSEAAAASFALLAGGALIVAPFAPQIEGTLRIGAVELTLRRRAIEAVKQAPIDSVEGVLPLLESDDIGVEQVPVPRQFVGKALTSPDLAYLRPDLKLSVIAVRRRGESGWRAGGSISDELLEEGSVMLVAGPRDALRQFREQSPSRDSSQGDN